MGSRGGSKRLVLKAAYIGNPMFSTDKFYAEDVFMNDSTIMETIELLKVTCTCHFLYFMFRNKLYPKKLQN